MAQVCKNNRTHWQCSDGGTETTQNIDHWALEVVLYRLEKLVRAAPTQKLAKKHR